MIILGIVALIAIAFIIVFLVKEYQKAKAKKDEEQAKIHKVDESHEFDTEFETWN